METMTIKVEDIFAEVMTERAWDNPVQEAIQRVRKHTTVSFEGVDLRVVEDRDIRDGDFYLSGRNLQDGVRFMEARVVDRDNGWVIPTPFGHAFNIRECVVVEPVE